MHFNLVLPRFIDEISNEGADLSKKILLINCVCDIIKEYKL